MYKIYIRARENEDELLEFDLPKYLAVRLVWFAWTNHGIQEVAYSPLEY